MFPGEYSICSMETREGTDCVDLQQLRWGFDTVEEARGRVAAIAEEEGVKVEDCCIIRMWPAVEQV